MHDIFKAALPCDGSLTATNVMLSPPIDAPAFLQQSVRILDSYSRWFGKNLVPREGSVAEQAQRLFFCKSPVLSTGTEQDPILNYGNRQTLKLWEMSWAEFTVMPGRLTAEPENRTAREAFLRQVREHGFITNYEGIRISRTGRRFQISDAQVWNIVDDQGSHCGQAATFGGWHFL